MVESPTDSATPPRRADLDEVRHYWSEHLNLTQFLQGQESALEVGSPEFFAAVRSSLDRFEYKRELLDEIWQCRSGDHLLEVGCGLGADLVELTKRGFVTTGIDLSPAVIEMTRGHFTGLGLSTDLRPANAEHLPFEDSSFDEVYSSGVFQHTPDPQRAINEAIRVLRSGGNMTVILYHRHSWFWLLSRLGRVNVEFQDQDAPIVESYSRGDLHTMFAGLRDLTIRFEHFRPVRTPRIGPVARVYNHILVPIAGLVPDFMLRPFGFHAVIRGSK